MAKGQTLLVAGEGTAVWVEADPALLGQVEDRKPPTEAEGSRRGKGVSPNFNQRQFPMRRSIFAVLAGAVLGVGLAPPAEAQSGFALKGHYIINSSAAEEAQESQQLPDADAFGLGAEVVLPMGLGVGVSGYTAQSDEGGIDNREFTVLGELNYFLSLPMLPIAPYAGLHAGLGVLDQENVTDPDLEIQDKNRSQLGYQLGVRVQLSPLVGLDAQWRRMSTSADADQDDRLERDQVLLGVTLF